MPVHEAPCVELGSAPQTPSIISSPSPSEISTTSSPEPPHVQATPLFRALAMRPPDPEQPVGQEELERRIPGYRRITIPRELTLIELLKEYSGVTVDEDVLRIREVKLRVVAERVGLRRLHILVPRLKILTLDGSALSSLRDLGIGLVHLKILSVKRCGLNSLDGIWGLGALREFYAVGNRLQNLQPIAALQKLHTLDLSENPISEASRLWTLGVCSSLRRLTLQGCPVSDDPQYRTQIASALPLLVYLDDRPMHTDIYDSSDEIFGLPSMSSDSEASEAECELTGPTEAEASTSKAQDDESKDVYIKEDDGDDVETNAFVKSNKFNVGERHLRRPATTEGAGVRPRLSVPPRPRTAYSVRVESATQSCLQILNTLLDEDMQCSGSSLTSCGAVCGNLAHALRRTSNENQRRRHIENTINEMTNVEIPDKTLENESRAAAAEIPHLPSLEDWEKFRVETGINIKLDFNERPKSEDPAKLIEKLEKIEKETSERFKMENLNIDNENDDSFMHTPGSYVQPVAGNNETIADILNLDFNMWRDIENLAGNATPPRDIRFRRDVLERLNNPI